MRYLRRVAVNFSETASNVRRFLSKSYTLILPYGPSPAASPLLSHSTHNPESYIYTNVRACYLSASSLTEETAGSLGYDWPVTPS